MTQDATRPSLLCLAAGIGSRYGGLKQIDPVGPGGETILDYSIYDAMQAGFEKVVFVIRKDIEKDFREVFGTKFEGRADVHYVFQHLDMIPEGFEVPPGRKKPWGTAHAVLVAEDAIQEPFAVINADDFYGRSAYKQLYNFLVGPCAENLYCMVGYTLRNTLSEHGSVARGVCEVDDEGYLKSIVEMTKIEKDGQGAKSYDPDGTMNPLSGEETVSMNIFGFHKSIFPRLHKSFSDFLQHHSQKEKSEFFIPTIINELLQAGTIRMQVLPSPDSWFGVTYSDDKAKVTHSIRQLIDEGKYPERLWG